MNKENLSDWLQYINKLHTQTIDLGLGRVQTVAARLALLRPTCPVIIVGGTNGKGSTVAGLSFIYRAAGYKVGTFTSPILFKHNEYVRINGEVASDADYCMAYTKIEAVRGEITLTPFEFHTLAALLIFKNTPLDVLVMEVGLGGRLDAVNILDADVAVVTSIDIDHSEYLGFTREAIGREKAGIFRPNKPAICGDFNPPLSLISAATTIGAPLYCQGKDFWFEDKAGMTTWSWSCADIQYTRLPRNALATQNMAIVLMAVTLLQDRLVTNKLAIENGLRQTTLPGRIEVIPGPITKILDVAHNPAAVKWLANYLKAQKISGRTLAIFSMLIDKDMDESLKAIQSEIDYWYVAPLKTERATPKTLLEQAFAKNQIQYVRFYAAIKEAYEHAMNDAHIGDRVVIFGSFYTVAAVL